MNKCLVFVLMLLMWAGSALAGDYVIGDGDLLKVSVWGVPELSVEVTVRPDGKITLPAAGDVVATGLTPVALSKELAVVLENFVKKPIVTVSVSRITNNRVYVSGGGVAPQVISLTGRTSLFKLLCSLGSLENVDLSRAYLLRQDGERKGGFYEIYVKGEFSRDFDLKAEDIIFLPTNERNKVYVVGAVQAPKYIIYREGMKVLDAILEAGGFTEYAKENSVIIHRQDKDQIKVRIGSVTEGKDVTQNVALTPGDYVIVREGMF
ncbi:sugar ABC transporter substrate-binding protein [Desulfuromonas versatilis]|uniref:Sugar ABC transporter substrate-binding protein n=1 Tax=Desulfuromonas versatilis TaxID=2802975 RepID=A0ABM8HTJ3_9BACT|nr:polysaccharide biosynthesis/export family protein [Desulfuromonas versatilis]BCR05290.1 sugar ABC transporter substrate-binding protein [Desulfuromonas versatilis]